MGVVAMQICACTEPAVEAPFTRGLYNWVHTTGDAERAFLFYGDVLGIELAGSPFAPAGAAPEGIRPVADAGSDELVWQLTNTRGSRYRTVFMHAANTPFGLELSEFFDIARGDRPPNAWDPGASMLIFEVRDLDAIVARLGSDTPVVTLGGAPLATPGGRSLLVRDPDGCLVRLTQASAAAIAAAREAGEVIATSIGVTVADTRASLEFYRDLLGFDVHAQRSAVPAELALHGLAVGQITVTNARIPGTDIGVLFSEFRELAGTVPPPSPYRWKIQDVGAPQFQLQVDRLDELLTRTQDAGHGFLSVNGRPIQRPFGRFVFAIDPDGVLVEFVEPATTAPIP